MMMMINSIDSYFDAALWLAGIGHFCVLGASFQVPYQLKWKTDLAPLLPLNRKLMWTYGLFTVMMIIAFGIITLSLHDELMSGGGRVANALLLLIGLFWGFRLCVDVFYFKHDDWPKGLYFKIGHALLFLLFIFLTSTYLGVVCVRSLK